MNQKEIDALSRRIEQGLAIDPAIELKWIEEALGHLPIEEQRFVLAFRMARFLNDDARMLEVDRSLVRVRETLEYLYNRKAEIETIIETTGK